MNLKDLFVKSKDIIGGFESSFRDFRLEEAEEDDRNYKVVVSYLIEDQNKPVNADSGNLSVFPLSLIQNQRNYERVFKRLIFNKDLELNKLAIFKE